MRLHALFLIFAACLSARQVTVTILATTDMHGNIFPYDYLVGKPAPRGLAKVATLIRAERTTAPSALLVDCGDTIQGSPLESVYQSYVSEGKLPLDLKFDGRQFTADPMMLAMNHLKYDAMAVGNHEFNYGLKNLNKARSDARFPWLSANTKTDPKSGQSPFPASIVKTVDGVKVGIIGITTPAVPAWEKAENYAGYSFVAGPAALKSAVADLQARHKPDIIVVIAHSGIDRIAKAETPGTPRENMADELAKVPGVHAVIFGHTHNQVSEMHIGGALLTQPKNWAMSLARVDLEMESKPEGGYTLLAKKSRVIPVTNATEADPEITRLAMPYHEITERYLNSVVAEAKSGIDASESRIKDTAMIDAVHAVQLHYAKADVSFASSFNPRAAIPRGPVTIRQIAALYLYDNELYAVEGTGKMVKDALENAAKFYNTCVDSSCSKSPLINSSIIGYNFDMAAGVTYEIDITRPAGDRVRNLKYHGNALQPDQNLRIALNNYRAGGSNGYSMFKGAKLLWRSYDDIRELIIRYYSEHELPTTPDGNWRVVPESAHNTLMHEVRRDTQATNK